MALAVIATAFAFGVGKQDVWSMFSFYDPFLTGLLIFLVIWLGFMNTALAYYYRRRDRNDEGRENNHD